MKNVIRTLVFWYAALTGHDEYKCEAGTLKFKFLNWLYEGDCEPEFGVIWPDLPPATGKPCDVDAADGARKQD